MKNTRARTTTKKGKSGSSEAEREDEKEIQGGAMSKNGGEREAQGPVTRDKEQGDLRMWDDSEVTEKQVNKTSIYVNNYQETTTPPVDETSET